VPDSQSDYKLRIWLLKEEGFESSPSINQKQRLRAVHSIFAEQRR